MGNSTLLAVLLSGGLGDTRTPRPYSMTPLRLVVRQSRIRLPPSFRSLTSASAPEPTSTFCRAAYGTLFALTAGVGAIYYFDSRAAIHRYLIAPLIRNVLDPESAHKLAVSVLENGLGPRDMLPDDERLTTEV
jgi:dihydroorotate dehydrogenase